MSDQNNLPKNKVKAKKGTIINEEAIFKYFVGEPRKGQERICSDLYAFLRSDAKSFLFQGATGIGKERAVASQIVNALGDGITSRIFWLVPTNEGKINIEKELNLITAVNKNVLVLHNKDSLCNIKEKISTEPDFSINDIPEKLHRELHEKFGIRCPYYDQLEKIPDANIIVSDYNYIVDPLIRSKIFKIEPDHNILIFNEVHLLPDRASDMVSNQLATKEIEYAIEELVNYGKESNKDIAQLKEFLENLRYKIESVYGIRKSDVEKDKQLGSSSEGKAKISWNDVLADEDEKTIPLLAEVGVEISKWKISKQSGVRSWTFLISRFLEYFYRNRSYRYMVYYIGEYLTEKEKEKRVTVGYKCLDPYPILKKTFETFNKIILYSATLYPDRYNQMLRLWKFGELIIPDRYPSPFPLENRKDLFFEDSLLTKAEREKPEVIQKVSDELNQVIPLLQKPLIVYGVHPLLNLVLPNMKTDGFKVLRETMGMKQNDRKQFMDQILQNDITYLSTYGAFSQSIDLSGIHSILILGIPIQKMEMVRRETMFYFINQFTKETGDIKKARIIAYDLICLIPAIERCIQSAGRAQRTEKDKVTVLWWERRWTKASKFVGSRNYRNYLNFEELMKGIA